MTKRCRIVDSDWFMVTQRDHNGAYWSWLERFECEPPADGESYVSVRHEHTIEDGVTARIVHAWNPLDLPGEVVL